MPVIELSPAHRQRRQGLPRLRAVNVRWDGRIGAFFGRPGLVLDAELGTGPIRGLFRQSGLFGGDRFVWSGYELYRGDSFVFAAAGEGSVRCAGGSNGDADCLVWCNGGQVWRYDNGAVNGIAIPDGTEIFDVLYFGNRFLFFAADGRFYFSGINDPTTIDALSFETAEARPDGFLRAVVSRNQMFVFGPETIEVFYLSSDPDAPFAPDTAARLDFGAYGADLVHEHQGRVWFVGSQKQVFALGGGLEAIGDDSVIEALGRTDLSEAGLCSVLADGVEMVVLTDRASGSFVFDGAHWYRWRRADLASLDIGTALTVGSQSFAGDMASGKVFRLAAGAFADEGGVIERVVSCYRPFAGGRQRNANVLLHCARAAGTLEVCDPKVEMRYSDDLGTWSDWEMKSLGTYGQYDIRPVWRGLGHLRPPGRVYEFRCTDAVDFAPQSVVVDEARL